jgi:hypothetical protein
MERVTLSGQDFKTIHNTLCDLRNIVQRMERSMIKIDEFERIIEGFEQGLSDAYAQDDSIFDRKHDYYMEFRRENGLGSIWSIYELPVHGFILNHIYPSDAFVVYRDHWGDNEDMHYPVLGPTWGDVYRAADLAIRNSGDEHHVFIEGFQVKGNELRLTTGS